MQQLKTKLLKTIGAASVVGLSLLANSAFAGPIIGSNDSGNCYPFSCLASDGGGTVYQQVYAASEFGGPISINAISFFASTIGEMDVAQYKVSFSTTSKAVGGLDATWANNIGADVAEFGVFNLGGIMPSVLTLTGTPFLYNPLNGNLLMHVDILGLTTAHGYESYFQADYTGAVTSRLWAYGTAVGDTNTGALVTEFNGGTPAPEPETVALMFAGLGLMGMMRKRKA